VPYLTGRALQLTRCEDLTSWTLCLHEGGRLEHSRAADLFRQHHVALLRYVYRQTGRRDAAEDVVQEVFVRVVRGLEAYRPDGRDVAWLFTIARRLLIDRRRSARRQTSEGIDACTPEPQSNPSQELTVALAEALSGVPEADREAFLLRELGGLSYQEIAAACESSVDSVRSRIYRARLRLRAALSTGIKVTT
jgi:RNA polymerase sigma-70 factor (ECF subfamily)